MGEEKSKVFSSYVKYCDWVANHFEVTVCKIDPLKVYNSETKDFDTYYSVRYYIKEE